MNHVVIPSNANNGYPMYFKTEAAENGKLIINAAHNKPIEVGDIFQLRYQGPEYKVSEIIETREP